MRKEIHRAYRISRYVVYKETLINTKEGFWSFIGAFVGIFLIGYIQHFQFATLENVFLIGSFGASAVLIYGAIESPLAQPRNLIGGHLISALWGVSVYQLIPNPIWLAAPLAVAGSIVFMQITKTLHPPGGATALIAVMGSKDISDLGFMYVLSPVLSGALILLLTALIFNNMTKHRVYPVNSRLYKRWQTMLRNRKKSVLAIAGEVD
jgi:CBS domain-containing membrane protein